MGFHVCTGDLTTRLVGLLKKPLSNFLIRLKRNSKSTSSNLLSPQRAQNKDVGAASQTLLTSIRLRLQCNAADHNIQENKTY